MIKIINFIGLKVGGEVVTQPISTYLSLKLLVIDLNIFFSQLEYKISLKYGLLM
mgnify:CR=1 FL=1